MLEILKGRELLKFFGGVIRSKHCRIKKFRGYEIGVMHTSSYFTLLSENVTFEIQTCVCLPSVLWMRVYLTWCVTMRRACRLILGIVVVLRLLRLKVIGN